jgi:hypothetical protein
MKISKSVLILLVIFSTIVVLSGCSAERGMGGCSMKCGCGVNKGMSGY